MASLSAMDPEVAGTTESAKLLVPAGDEAVAPHRHRYRTLGIATVAFGAVAVLVMSVTHAPRSLRRFASQSGIMLSEETTTGDEPEEEELKEGYHWEHQCGIDYKLQNVLHNNLGGQGPGEGKEGIVYNATQNNDGKFVRNILVKVNAMSDYACASSSHNGMSQDFGTIRVAAGKSVHLKMSFYDQEGEPLTLSVFRITFYDIDQAKGGKSVEYVIGYGDPELDTSKDSEVNDDELKAGIKVKATHVGSGGDNPKDSSALTDEQRDKSAVMEYKDAHAIEVKLGSTEGTAPRAFSFALHSALACEKVQVKDEEENSGAKMTSPAAQMLFVAAGSLLLALSRF